MVPDTDEDQLGTLLTQRPDPLSGLVVRRPRLTHDVLRVSEHRP